MRTLIPMLSLGLLALTIAVMLLLPIALRLADSAQQLLAALP